MKADVLIVGGGIVGVAAALELAERGAEVTLVERGRIGHGCSLANAGWLTPSQALPLPAPGLLWKASKWLLDPASPLYIEPRLDRELFTWLVRFLAATRRSRFERGAAALVELCRFSLDRFADLAARLPESFAFERGGLLAVYETTKALDASRATVDLVTRLGNETRALGRDELAAFEPAIRGPQVGGYFHADDGWCEPLLAVEALAAEAARKGARLLTETEVLDFERDGRRIRSCATTKGEIAAGEVVLAVGSWSKPLGARLGLRLPVLGGKGYSFVLPAPSPSPKRAVVLAERKIAITPRRDGLRVAGTLELVDGDLSINPRRVKAILDGAQALLRLPEPVTPAQVWSGLRPCTPDGLPLIGRARGYDNLWLATGHQMTGLKTAPGTARLLAELMAGEATTFDPGPFRADRLG